VAAARVANSQVTSSKSTLVTLEEEIPAGSITGCRFSNELRDALLVHQFVIEKRAATRSFRYNAGRGKEQEKSPHLWKLAARTLPRLWR